MWQKSYIAVKQYNIEETTQREQQPTFPERHPFDEVAAASSMLTDMPSRLVEAVISIANNNALILFNLWRATLGLL